MKLIIDIPEDIYDAILAYKEGNMVILEMNQLVKLDDAIRNSTPLKEWLLSFNTDSAPICFNKIQELKRECERDERTTKGKEI